MIRIYYDTRCGEIQRKPTLCEVCRVRVDVKIIFMAYGLKKKIPLIKMKCNNSDDCGDSHE